MDYKELLEFIFCSKGQNIFDKIINDQQFDRHWNEKHQFEI